MVSVEAQREIDRLFSAFEPVEPPLWQRRRNWEQDSLTDVLPEGARFSPAVAGGIASEWAEMPGSQVGPVFLWLHGGGYNAGSPKIYRKLASHLSRVSGLRVLTPDYRLAPEHPFPAAVDDALAAYQWLLRQGLAGPDIILGGDSAGGGLALSLLLTLKAQDQPMPRAAVVLAPWTDLTCSSSSCETLRTRDPIIVAENLRAAALMYAGRSDTGDPVASPLFGDPRGLPPLLIHAGGDEVMVDDSRLFAERAQAAGVDVTCKIWPGMWHVFQTACPDVPEAAVAMDEIGAFIKARYA